MLKFKTKKSHDKEASEKLPHGHEVYDYHVESIFLGNHTIFSLLGLAIGADLVGRTIFEYVSSLTNSIFVLGLGLLLFVLCGLLVGSFKD